MNFKRMLFRKWVSIYTKIVREKATPEYIARGWAIGMFFGCLIPMGLQLLLSIPTAFVLKGSKIGATIGTLITNHFTVIFIYPVQCWVGNWLFGGGLTYAAIRDALADVIREQSWGALMGIGGELITAFFVGGALLTAIMTPLTYYLVRYLVTQYRKRRAERKRRREITV